MTIARTERSHALAALGSGGFSAMVRCFAEGAVTVFDGDLRCVKAGGDGLSDVGLTSQLVEGHTISEIFPAAIAAVIEPRYVQALAGQESTFDVSFQDRVYLQRVAPLLDGNDVIVGVLGTSQDVTADRHNERALRPVSPTGASSQTASNGRSTVPSARDRWPCCSAISTASSGSTTGTDTRPATLC